MELGAEKLPGLPAADNGVVGLLTRDAAVLGLVSSMYALNANVETKDVSIVDNAECTAIVTSFHFRSRRVLSFVRSAGRELSLRWACR